MASKTKISYTNKDVVSIYNELLAAIPLLTDKWKNFAEDDPGIVLIKAAAFIGDMLCYNMDFQVNEVFPQTALQRTHAQNSYDLICYKMHWFRSAECTIRITFTRPDSIPINQPLTVVIPEFAELLTPDKIPYVIIGNVEARTIILSANQASVSKNFVAIQGSSMKQLNITLDRVINNGRIYVSNYAIEEDEQNNTNYPHMRLETYDSTTNLPLDDGLWTKISNLLDIKEEGKYYELKVDNNNQPYIQLCDNYLDFISQTNNYLGLSYIISNGSKGAVAENIGFRFNTAITFTYNGSNFNLSEYITINNTQSSQGRNPETVKEAAKTAAKEARTLGVAITLSDYENLCKTVDGIRACLALDYSKDEGTDMVDISLMTGQVLDDGVLLAQVPDMFGYTIEPNSIDMKIYYVDGTAKIANIVDNGLGDLCNADNDNLRVYASHIDYASGRIRVDVAPWNINFLSGNSGPSNITNITISYKRIYAPYMVMLKLIANDYGYLSDYSKEVLDEILQNKTVSTVKFVYENAKIKSVPFNVGIYAYEPWNANDPSLTNYISTVVKNTLSDYFASADRIFGETLSYPNLCLELQNSDSKIKLADLYYPTRNYKILADEYPRLGPVCVNLSDNTNFAWLLENLFEETLTANTNYNTMATSIFGTNFATVLNENTSVNEITSPLTLINSVTVAGKTLPITWWCSRPDLVVVGTTNQTIWGNLTSASITEDTPITLYAIAHYGDASMALCDQPVNLILKKYEEA